MRRVRPFVLIVGLLVQLLTPVVVLAAGGAGPAPSETCVPGTVWEDTASGVKYICVYDELYGGSRWEPMPGNQTGNEAWTYRSSTYGCAFQTVGLTGSGGYGADSIIRSYRWPCQTAAHRISQPTGELRSRIVIQRYASGWTTCRDTGYRYSTTVATGWLAGFDMGPLADCGAGTYRAWGYGSFYQGGAWRGGSLTSPSLRFR